MQFVKVAAQFEFLTLMFPGSRFKPLLSRSLIALVQNFYCGTGHATHFLGLERNRKRSSEGIETRVMQKSPIKPTSVVK